MYHEFAPLTRLCEDACSLIAKVKDEVLSYVDSHLMEAIEAGYQMDRPLIEVPQMEQAEVDKMEGWR